MKDNLEGIINEIYERYGEEVIHKPTKEFYKVLENVCGGKEFDNEAIYISNMQDVMGRFKTETRGFLYGEGGETIEYQGIRYRNFCGANFENLQKWQKNIAFITMESLTRNINEYGKRAELLKYFPKGELRYFTSGNKAGKGNKSETKNLYGRYSAPGKGRKYIGKKYLDTFKMVIDTRNGIKGAVEGYRQIIENDLEILEGLTGIKFDLAELTARIYSREVKCEIYNENRNAGIKKDEGDGGRKDKCVAVDSKYVASRIEVILANLLKEKNIPYLCEEQLSLNPGHRNPYKVDFSYGIMVNDRLPKNKIYVEILGMMDRGDYYGKAYDKIANYSRLGIKVGRNLICFVSGSEKVNANIMNQVLVMSMYGFVPVDYVIV